MRRKDTEFRIKNNNLRAPNESDIISFFRDIWYNSLTKQSINNNYIYQEIETLP